MPYRKTSFTSDAHYHIYNRGVEKRIIFLDDQDYQTFLDILTYYLKFTKKSPLNALTRTGLVNTGLFQNEITLLAYCLMPNHFHLLLHQTNNDSITKFIRRIATTYSMYFNKRYQRVGSLFQGRFRAKHIDTDSYLLQTSKYIHRNPIELATRTGLVKYRWGSYSKYTQPNIIDQPIHSVTQPSNILEFFSQSNPKLSYQTFVEETPLPDWYNQELQWIK